MNLKDAKKDITCIDGLLHEKGKEGTIFYKLNYMLKMQWRISLAHMVVHVPAQFASSK